MGGSMGRYPNYYAVLQVAMTASAQEVKHAWKHLLQKKRKHPDLGGSEEDAALINEAYSVLKNPLRRGAYDRLYITHVIADEQAPPSVNGNDNEHSPPAQNRRRVRRVNYVNEVYVQKPSSDNSWPAQAQDISLYGIRIRTVQKIKPSDVLEVSFAQDPGFMIQGTVQWHRMIPQRFGNPLYEAGLEFKGMNMGRFVEFLERSGLANLVSE